MKISFEQHHLKSSKNISMQKVQGMQITTGTVKQNYKEQSKGYFLLKMHILS